MATRACTGDENKDSPVALIALELFYAGTKIINFTFFIRQKVQIPLWNFQAMPNDVNSLSWNNLSGFSTNVRFYGFLRDENNADF